MGNPKPLVPLRKQVKPMPRFAFTTRLAFNEAENVAELLLILEPGFERQRRGTCQPRATPWDCVPIASSPEPERSRTGTQWR